MEKIRLTLACWDYDRTRALQERTSLVGEDLRDLAAFGRRPNHTKGRAVASRRERARVAVRQDAGVFWHDFRAEPAHRAAALDIFIVNGSRFALQSGLQLVDRLPFSDAGAK